MRLLGCALVAAAGAFMGLRAAARLRKQLRVLDEIAEGLGLLEQELELHAPELEELMCGLSDRTQGAAKQLFSSFGTSVIEGEGTVAEQWGRSVSNVEELIPDGKLCLYGLGEVLGRYDCREQRNCVAAVRRRLEHIREAEGVLCRSRCRTCQTVGLSGGAFLIILLL